MPLATEMRLIAFAMFSTAMRMKPSATSSGARPVFAASSANAARTRPSSSGASPAGPKIFGKYSPFSLPTMTFASVTVSGPPWP